MVRLLTRLLALQSRTGLSVTSLLLIGAVGCVDYLTGYELSFSVFYLIPVAIAAWYLGYRLGIVACLISTVTWLSIEYSATQYSHISIPFWNAGVRLGFFIITTILLDRLHEALTVQASLAERDELTGLLNRRTFLKHCSEMTRVATRYRHPMAFCFFDIDGFKGLNDQHGHSEGDRLLKAVAEELIKRARVSDAIGRMGGDEFVVFLPETNLVGAKTLFNDMRAGLLDRVAREGWPVGFSIGVAVFNTPPDTVEGAMRCADLLMYKVKHSGKNNMLFAEDPDIG